MKETRDRLQLLWLPERPYCWKLLWCQPVNIASCCHGHNHKTERAHKQHLISPRTTSVRSVALYSARCTHRSNNRHFPAHAGRTVGTQRRACCSSRIRESPSFDDVCTICLQQAARSWCRHDTAIVVLFLYISLVR